MFYQKIHCLSFWILAVASSWFDGLSPEVFADTPPPSTRSTGLRQAQALFEKGNYEEALAYAIKASRQHDSERASDQKCDALLLMAAAYQELGRPQLAFESLEEARILARNLTEPSRQMLVQMRLSDLYLTVGQVDDGEELGFKVLEKARELDDPRLLAMALNHWGNILVIYQDYPEAIEAYEESYALVASLGDKGFAIRLLLNLGHVATEANRSEIAFASLNRARELLSELVQGYEKASLMLSLGIQAAHLLEVQGDDSARGDLKDLAWKALTEADKLAAEIKDDRLRSYAYGYLGELYETEDRYDEALRLTRRALFFAQQAYHPEVLYRWQWQLGRLHRKRGHIQEAIAAYEEAVQTLNPIRRDLSLGYRKGRETFPKRVKPVYYELADLYLQKANRASVGFDRQNQLKLARETIETMKQAELEDLFQDECVTALEAKATSLDKLVPGTAVIYPIPLADRLVILATLPDGVYQFTTEVSLEEFEKTIRQFRRDLQTRTKKVFIYSAKKLYQWLIQPLKESLEKADIGTLIIVPDGILSLIPFSTLHDGEQFLIENYALVTTPGLRLTDPQPIGREDLASLLVGLSHSVQGYSALPNVGQELEVIQEILGGDVLLNQQYTASNVTDKLQGNPYRIMHMATHGEFDSNPQKTYLLTHDKKLALDELEDLIKLSRFRDKPIELLTLSACRTAVGDEKAALGLAGIAVKSGARSVIATLWFVDDEATMLAITEFYRQFQKNPHLTKAQALQNAQKALMAQPRYRHPAYWAPFLLIGNWL